MDDAPPETPPIEPVAYRGGVKVVDIGDLRVARGMSRRPWSACSHASLVYDNQERRIWCSDCKTDVEPFDAFRLLVEKFDAADANIRRRREELSEAEKFQARALATKNLDAVWRSRSMVPACPHCGHGLLPEQFKSGVGMVGREYAVARIAAEKAKKERK